MTFDEFVRRFSSEQDCPDYLFELRWGNGFVCPKCGHAEYRVVNRVLCTCKGCRHQASVLAGTIFQDTRKPLKSWFTAIWWITTQKYGASARGLQQILGLKSYQTAWAWLHKIRTAMVNPNRAKLSGTVEIEHLQAYLDEYVFRFNRRTSAKRGLLFYRLLENAVIISPTTYAELVRKT